MHNINTKIDEVVAGLVPFETAHSEIVIGMPENELWFLTRLAATIRQRKGFIVDPTLRDELIRVYLLVNDRIVSTARVSAEDGD